MPQLNLKNENESQLTDEEINEQLKELFKTEESEAERQAGVIMLYPPIEFSDEELTVLCNAPEFMKGYKLGAELVGLYTTMVNGGMDALVANNIATNHHAMYVNIETQKVINEGVRIQGAAVKKTQL